MMPETIIVISSVIYSILISVICSNKETAVHCSKVDTMCRSYQFDLVGHSPETSSHPCSIKTKKRKKEKRCLFHNFCVFNGKHIEFCILIC